MATPFAIRAATLSLGFSALLCAQTPAAPGGDQPQPPAVYTVEAGTRVPLGLINSVSTKHSSPGDRIYLETVFPVVIGGHIVIPAGSYVIGTVTDVKRPGRVKGRGEIYVRFDSITLPNGVTREFRSRLGAIDSTANERLIDKKEGVVQSDSNKSGDARTVGIAAASGASIGAIAGSGAGHAVEGTAIGAGAGAAAGLAAVLLTRGPEAILAKGSTIEMVLDRPLNFGAEEVNFSSAGTPGQIPTAPAAQSGEKPPIRKFPY